MDDFRSCLLLADELDSLPKKSIRFNYNPFFAMEARHKLAARTPPPFRRALLAWYEHNRRDLPWRKTSDPYRIWISEIMLQQTRVAAVLPRYENFLRRFPSVKKLASAKIDSVLAEWSGLGYYHRARNLHAAARMVARERGGEFPETSKAWSDLPGIGRYTAAAISSIAFNEPVAVLDGNVERVLNRLLGNGHSRQESWNAAQELLDRKRPGDFNQAIMELGATICVPGEPLCSKCPVRNFCRTRGRGESGRRRPRQQKVSAAFVLASRGDSILLTRRSTVNRLMPGMWELPQAGNSFRRSDVLFTLRHSITVTDYTIAVVAQTPVREQTARWVRTSQINRLPLTGLARKILRRARIIE